MANISLYRGGTPEVKYIWSAADHPEYRPPFSQRHLGAQSDLFADERPLEETPPYDSHADGAYNIGNFVIGLPVAPRTRGQAAQRKALQAQPLEVGDILQCIWLPEDHIATYLNLKSITNDENMAGATVALVVQNATPDKNGEFHYVEDTDFADAVTTQVGSNSFAIDKPFNAFVSLFKAVGVDKEYAVPMYGKPALPVAHDAPDSTLPTYPTYKIFGLKILSLPTKSEVTFADMLSAIYMSLRMEAFECPSAN